ncbi:hypothetical protein [Intestinibacillus sp. Marseille-P6563]|uniref:hypothetical protein n=1 Tax=Intestinibacillus sp. Marseille-P6563 TaxID=2364792 RepID=UPI0013E0D9D3|nr:hypothetical protein [Intestinibacillus sp. Marseille-P6563]
MLDVCYKRELAAKKQSSRTWRKNLIGQRDLGRLKTETMKFLSGESDFSMELLSEVIQEQE